MRRHVAPALALLAGVLLPALAAAQAPPAPAARRAVGLADLSAALEDLAARVAPSLVQIEATGLAIEATAATSDGLLQPQRSSGSGVVIDPSGLIATNYHVVEGARRVVVLLPPTRRTSGGGYPLTLEGRRVEATVVGVDEETDLALLKVDTGAPLPALALGDSDALRPGQIVCAFGNPLGLDNTVTMGVVSAVGRHLEPDDPMYYVQTDAPINPGSSGGPLVDTAGRVVGINTLILTQGGGSEGIGFAVPSNIVRTVVDQLRRHGRVKRGTAGLAVQSITPLLADALKLPQPWGALVVDVLPGGTGAAAGARIGDIVVAFDGKEIESGRQFDDYLYRRAAGDVANLVVLRDGQRVALPVAVGERESDASGLESLVTRETNVIPRLGVLALPFNPGLATMVGDARLPGGVIVAARAGAAAGEYGLQAGDIIFSVNGTPVRGLDDLRGIIAGLPANAPCALQVQRQGELFFLSFELE